MASMQFILVKADAVDGHTYRSKAVTSINYSKLRWYFEYEKVNFSVFGD